jgi:hypothetical protein
MNRIIRFGGPSAKSEAAEENRIKLIRNFALLSFIQAAALAIGVFVLWRIVIPDLVDAHDDTLGILAIVCALAIPAIVGWAGFAFYLGLRRLRRRLALIQGPTP